MPRAPAIARVLCACRNATENGAAVAKKGVSHRLVGVAPLDRGALRPEPQGMFDVHLHSDASDGEAPLSVVARAIARRPDLVRVALTDHDTVVPALALAAIEPRAWVGAELTSYVGRTRVDMLALGIRPDDTTLTGYLAGRADERRARFALFGELLRAQGWEFDPPAATWAKNQLAQPHVVAELRRHEANLARLAGMGIARIVDDGVDDPIYLHVLDPLRDVVRARTEASVAESPAMVGLIHAAGALAIIAHPWPSAYDEGRTSMLAGRAVLAPIIAAGVDGVELWHPSQIADPAAFAEIASVASAHDLLVTAGSDDHSADLRWLGASSPLGADARRAIERLEAAWTLRQGHRSR